MGLLNRFRRVLNFEGIKPNGLFAKTEHRTVKYLNNLIEQDHRPIKR
jgi:Transposase and inactivated derivatives